VAELDPKRCGIQQGASLIRFTILGEPASKANSRELVTFGRGENKRPALIKSQKARDYERHALRQIPPLARQRLDVPVRVTVTIFYASERPDLDASVVLDCLQDRWHGKGEARELVQKGVIRNDRQVRELHLFHAIDRANPRAEIEIEPLAPAQSPMALPEPQAEEEPF
jgi:Holliday junction resolvase RusA-like endonuclease